MNRTIPANAPTSTSTGRKRAAGRGKRTLSHRQQWRSTLASLPASFRDLPVDEIGPKQVFDALDPIWANTPETASRLRGRIAAVLDFAREPEDARPNPAAWSGWLKNCLGSAKALGKIDPKTGERVARGHYAALAYVEIVIFLPARLSQHDSAAAGISHSHRDQNQRDAQGDMAGI